MSPEAVSPTIDPNDKLAVAIARMKCVQEDVKVRGNAAFVYDETYRKVAVDPSDPERLRVFFQRGFEIDEGNPANSERRVFLKKDRVKAEAEYVKAAQFRESLVSEHPKEEQRSETFETSSAVRGSAADFDSLLSRLPDAAEAPGDDNQS